MRGRRVAEGWGRNLLKIHRQYYGAIAVILTVSAYFGPANAFELFGFRFFEDNAAQKIEVLDPQTYKMDFKVAGAIALRDRLRGASGLWQDRDEPAAGSAGLIAKARADYSAILAALYRAGYYGGSIEIRVAGQEVSGISLFADFPANVLVTVQVDPGKIFNFGRLNVQNPAIQSTDFGFASGLPARSSVLEIVAGATIAAWRQRGFAKAGLAGQDVVADHATSVLDVTLAFDPGPKVRFGLTNSEGSKAVDGDFIRYMADIPEGSRFDPDVLEQAQKRLARLGVFGSVRIVEGELVDGDILPVTIALQDRLPRRFGFGATFSSTDGLALEGFWLHHNLFGRAEQLRIDGSIGGIDGIYAFDRYDYVLAASLTVPGVIEPDTDFKISGELHHLNLAGYEDDSLALSIGLSHVFSDLFSFSIFGDLERSRFTTGVAVEEITIASLTTAATLNTRDDALNATRGYYLSAEVSPYQVLESGGNGISVLAEGRAYFALDEAAKFVVAGRAKFGSVIGPDAADVPPDRLFFAGGGGSIRGYGYQSVGAGVLAGDPVGGLSLVETSLELRAKVSAKFGVVGFFDAGLVGPDRFPNGGERFLAGAGVGLRYFTGLGPLRVDLAVPIKANAGYAVYIGIGQAF